MFFEHERQPPSSSDVPHGPQGEFSSHDETAHERVQLWPLEAFRDPSPGGILKEGEAIRHLQKEIAGCARLVALADEEDESPRAVATQLASAIDTIFAPLVGDGSSFAVAAATMRSFCPLPDLRYGVSQRPHHERIQIADRRALLDVVTELERLHTDLQVGESVKYQLPDFTPRIMSRPDRQRPVALEGIPALQARLLVVLERLAERSLDVSPLLEALRDPQLLPVALNRISLFQSHTNSGESSPFALAYREPDAVRQARSQLMQGLWKQGMDLIREGGHARFFYAFAVLVDFEAAAMPYFREYMRMLREPRRSDPKPHPNTHTAVFSTLSQLNARVYQPFLRSTSPSSLSFTNPTSIIEDALALCTHHDERIQKYAYSFLRKVAWSDARVKLKFERLEVQLEDLGEEIRVCVLSMKPVADAVSCAEDPKRSLGLRKSAIESLRLRIRERGDPEARAALQHWRDAPERLASELRRLVSPQDSGSEK